MNNTNNIDSIDTVDIEETLNTTETIENTTSKENKEDVNTSSTRPSFKRFAQNHPTLVAIVAFLLVWLLFSINFSFLSVSGDSMEPSLHNGDLLFSRKTFMSLDRFDIIVCFDEHKLPIIKRLIGLPGETVECKDNQLYINGEPLEENYSMGNTEDFKVQIGIDNYYCLGDNREHSKDSRAIGQIPKENIIAEVLFR